MKTNVYSIDGKKAGEITLPSFFSSPVREDIVLKVVETRKNQQPYSNSLVAGKQSSADSIFRKVRKVWKGTYGKGQSRVPRKIMMRRGAHFYTIGASTSGTRGGRKTHSPNYMGWINDDKINRKEELLALRSALAATANPKFVKKKYASLANEKTDIALVVIEKLNNPKTKELIGGLKIILGNAFDVAIRTKAIRAGKGVRRGRRYKTNAGLLIVVGKDERVSNSAFEVVNAKNVNVLNLARGGVGRLTVYTTSAMKELEERLK